MKIIYDHQIFSRQSYGGVSRYFHEISERIPAIAGDHVEVFAPLNVNRYASPRGIRIKKIKGGTPFLGLINTAMGKILISRRSDISIFHETYFSRFSYAPQSAKRVVTVYDMIHELFPSSFSKYDQTVQAKLHAVRHADHVICISESTRRDLLRFTDIPQAKISVVHLGHSMPDRISTPSNGSEPPATPYLLYVGHRKGYKNFEGFLRAYATSPLLKGQFSIVCFGGGGFTPTELALAESLGVKPNRMTRITGSDGLLGRLYASASVFVYPSLYEGFGIPPLEAMAHGCPVAASNTSSIPEVVGEAAELFEPNEPEDVRAAIERIVCSPEHAQALVAKGRHQIEKFTWDACAHATLNVYRQITGI